MKRNLHKISGSQIRDVYIVSNRFGSGVFMFAKSNLDAPSEARSKDGKLLTRTDGKSIQIKLPEEVLVNFLKNCDLTISKKIKWWWVNEIQPKQKPAPHSVRTKVRNP